MRIAKVLIFVALVLGAWRAEAATLHAIYVIDSTDPTIGDTAQVDLQRVEQLVQQAAARAGLDYQPSVFAGNDFRADRVTRQLRRTHPEAEDLVLFYYSGHGIHTKTKKNGWPDLRFRLDDRNIDLQLIAAQVSRMHPKLGLIIADCCNNQEYPYEDEGRIRAPAFRPLDDRVISHLAHLFTQTEGVWVAAGAQEGQAAYSDDRGGYFTNSLLQTLNEGPTEMTYPQIFVRAAHSISHIQTPIWSQIS